MRPFMKAYVYVSFVAILFVGLISECEDAGQIDVGDVSVAEISIPGVFF